MNFPALKSLWIAACLVGGGCAPVVAPSVLSTVDEVRQSAPVTAAKKDAPRSFLIAEKHRQQARTAVTEGDVASAQILGERAQVGYEQTIVTARAVQAARRGEELSKQQAKAQAALATQRAEVQRLRADVRALEEQLARAVHKGSGPEVVDRALGARLRHQGHLLCTAAKLLRGAISDERLDAALKTLEALPKGVGQAKAAKARSGCLEALKGAKGAQGNLEQALLRADRLLVALSESGWTVHREDAGIRVSLPAKGAGPYEATFKRIEALVALGAAVRGFAAIVVINPSKRLSGVQRAKRIKQHQPVLKALRAGFSNVGIVVSPDPVSTGLSKRDGQQLSLLLVSSDA